MKLRRSIGRVSLLAGALATAGTIGITSEAHAAVNCYVKPYSALYYYWYDGDRDGDFDYVVSQVAFRGQGITVRHHFRHDDFGFYAYGKLWGGRDNVWISINDLTGNRACWDMGF